MNPKLTDARAAYVAGLAVILAGIDSGSVPLPGFGRVFSFQASDRGQFIAVARGLGATGWTEETYGVGERHNYEIKGRVHGVAVSVFASREDVCTATVVRREQLGETTIPIVVWQTPLAEILAGGETE